MIKLTSPDTYTAVIDGTEWQNITPESRFWDAVQGMMKDGAKVEDLTIPLPTEPDIPTLTRAQFCVALTKTTPPIFTPAEALAALEVFPPKFMPALAGKPLEYQAMAIAGWRETKTVARNAQLFLDLLAFYGGAIGLSEEKTAALGDRIFAQG